MSRRLLPAVLGLLLAALALAGCGPGTAPAGASTDGEVRGTITVFAASSLTDVFSAAGEAFTAGHPGARVEFNFQSSSALLAQLEQGAPGDVFASADVATMRRALDRGVVEAAPVTFARNRPVVVVPADDRAGIASVRDLAKPGVKLVLAAPGVPAGDYAREAVALLGADPAYGEAFARAVLANVVSNEANVRAVLTKVELGEADAGVVYRTDVHAAGGRVRVVPLPDAAAVVADYPIAPVAASDRRAAAQAFIDFLTSADGRRLLRDAGFEVPS